MLTSGIFTIPAHYGLLPTDDPDDRHGLLLQLNAGKLDKALPKKLRENLEKRLTVSAGPGSLHGTVDCVPVPALSIGCAVPVGCAGHATSVPVPGCTNCTAWVVCTGPHCMRVQLPALARSVGCAAAVAGEGLAACLPWAMLHGNVGGWASHLHCLHCSTEVHGPQSGIVAPAGPHRVSASARNLHGPCWMVGQLF